MRKLTMDASTAAKWQLSDEAEAEQARHMLYDYAAGRVAFVGTALCAAPAQALGQCC